jgi:hypothetical protein
VVLLFAKGRGIAAAKALIECTTTGGLTLAAREDARLYYAAPVDAELAFVDKFADWEARGCKVRPAVLTPAAGSPYVSGGVREAFDADDVMYDPALTAAIIFGDEEFEKEARALAHASALGLRGKPCTRHLTPSLPRRCWTCWRMRAWPRRTRC